MKPNRYKRLGQINWPGIVVNTVFTGVHDIDVRLMEMQGETNLKINSIEKINK